MTILKAEKLSLGYPNNQNIIENVDLSLSPGEVLAIQGPNGCGKSTLMKGLARHLKPTAGAVTLDQDIWQIKPADFARQVAYVPQSMEAVDMSVREMVALGRNPHQRWWSNQISKSDSATIDSALARCGLSSLQDKPLSELSGGEKQRAMIAMALAQEPRFILLDEPTANLDFRYQLEVLKIIKELKEQMIGVAVILHDLNLSVRIADQIALLGRAGSKSIAAWGRPEEVLQPLILQQVFDVELAIIRDSEHNLNLYVPVSISLQGDAKEKPAQQ